MMTSSGSYTVAIYILTFALSVMLANTRAVLVVNSATLVPTNYTRIYNMYILDTLKHYCN